MRCLLVAVVLCFVCGPVRPWSLTRPANRSNVRSDNTLSKMISGNFMLGAPKESWEMKGKILYAKVIMRSTTTPDSVSPNNDEINDEYTEIKSTTNTYSTSDISEEISTLDTIRSSTESSGSKHHTSDSTQKLDNKENQRLSMDRDISQSKISVRPVAHLRNRTSQNNKRKYKAMLKNNDNQRSIKSVSIEQNSTIPVTASKNIKREIRYDIKINYLQPNAIERFCEGSKSENIRKKRSKWKNKPSNSLPSSGSWETTIARSINVHDKNTKTLAVKPQVKNYCSTNKLDLNQFTDRSSNIKASERPLKGAFKDQTLLLRDSENQQNHFNKSNSVYRSSNKKYNDDYKRLFSNQNKNDRQNKKVYSSIHSEESINKLAEIRGRLVGKLQPLRKSTWEGKIKNNMEHENVNLAKLITPSNNSNNIEDLMNYKPSLKLQKKDLITFQNKNQFLNSSSEKNDHMTVRKFPVKRPKNHNKPESNLVKEEINLYGGPLKNQLEDINLGYNIKSVDSDDQDKDNYYLPKPNGFISPHLKKFQLFNAENQMPNLQNSTDRSQNHFSADFCNEQAQINLHDSDLKLDQSELCSKSHDNLFHGIQQKWRTNKIKKYFLQNFQTKEISSNINNPVALSTVLQPNNETFDSQNCLTDELKTNWRLPDLENSNTKESHLNLEQLNTCNPQGDEKQSNLQMLNLMNPVVGSGQSKLDLSAIKHSLFGNVNSLQQSLNFQNMSDQLNQQRDRPVDLQTPILQELSSKQEPYPNLKSIQKIMSPHSKWDSFNFVSSLKESPLSKKKKYFVKAICEKTRVNDNDSIEQNIRPGSEKSELTSPIQLKEQMQSGSNNLNVKNHLSQNYQQKLEVDNQENLAKNLDKLSSIASGSQFFPKDKQIIKFRNIFPPLVRGKTVGQSKLNISPEITHFSLDEIPLPNASTNYVKLVKELINVSSPVHHKPQNNLLKVNSYNLTTYQAQNQQPLFENGIQINGVTPNQTRNLPYELTNEYQLMDQPILFDNIHIKPRLEWGNSLNAQTLKQQPEMKTRKFESQYSDILKNTSTLSYFQNPLKNENGINVGLSGMVSHKSESLNEFDPNKKVENSQAIPEVSISNNDIFQNAQMDKSNTQISQFHHQNKFGTRTIQNPSLRQWDTVSYVSNPMSAESQIHWEHNSLDEEEQQQDGLNLQILEQELSTKGPDMQSQNSSKSQVKPETSKSNTDSDSISSNLLKSVKLHTKTNAKSQYSSKNTEKSAASSTKLNFETTKLGNPVTIRESIKAKLSVPEASNTKSDPTMKNSLIKGNTKKIINTKFKNCNDSPSKLKLDNTQMEDPESILISVAKIKKPNSNSLVTLKQSGSTEKSIKGMQSSVSRKKSNKNLALNADTHNDISDNLRYDSRLTNENVDIQEEEQCEVIQPNPISKQRKNKVKIIQTKTKSYTIVPMKRFQTKIVMNENNRIISKPKKRKTVPPINITIAMKNLFNRVNPAEVSVSNSSSLASDGSFKFSIELKDKFSMYHVDPSLMKDQLK